MSSRPNVVTACSIAPFTCASSRTSTTSGSALPPTRVISSAAVKIVPGSLGCGLSVLAWITMLAPSRAARNAIARPMPRDAPVMNKVRPLSVMIPQSFRSGSAKDEFSGERRVGAIAAKAYRRKRLLGKERAAGRQREQPQIRCRPGQRREVIALAAEEPMGGALQSLGRVLQPHAGPPESRVVDGVDGFDRALDLADIRQHRRAARKR